MYFLTVLYSISSLRAELVSVWLFYSARTLAEHCTPQGTVLRSL